MLTNQLSIDNNIELLPYNTIIDQYSLIQIHWQRALYYKNNKQNIINDNKLNNIIINNIITTNENIELCLIDLNESIILINNLLYV